MRRGVGGYLWTLPPDHRILVKKLADQLPLKNSAKQVARMPGLMHRKGKVNGLVKK